MSDALRANIEEPVSGERAARGVLRVVGWALDEAELLESAMLVVDGGRGEPVRLGVWRPDVGAAYPSVPHASAAGFEGNLDLRGHEGGVARIALLVRTPGGLWREVTSVEVEVEAGERERPGDGGSAAFTIVQDEPTMLPVWLGYYSRYFDASDLYVLDHDTRDGSTSGLEGRCRVVPVYRDVSFDHDWLRSTVQSFQAFLLRSYETVLFAEVDELLVADPRRHDGLDAYIRGLTRPAVRGLGFNVVQQPDEPPLRFDEPLLAQRRYWHASRQYSKRLLARMPLRWSAGFHGEYDAPDDPPDPELMVVHLHRVDRDACLARHASSASRRWNEADLEAGAGAQNRIVEPDEFEAWFREGADLDAPRELIPDHIRGVL